MATKNMEGCRDSWIVTTSLPVVTEKETYEGQREIREITFFTKCRGKSYQTLHKQSGGNEKGKEDWAESVQNSYHGRPS